MNLICEIQYWPLNNSNNIKVEWYRSRSEESAGIEGEILIDRSKYTPYDINLTPVEQSFIRQYQLRVLNFNSSDRGYYWCQMVVNNVSLSPSPYGHIYGSQCYSTLFDVTCIIDQPLCAQNLSARFTAHRQGNGTNSYCSLEFNSIISTRTITTSQMSTNIIAASKLPITTVSNVFKADDSSQCNFSKDGCPCSIGIIAGIFVFIVALLMLSAILYFFVKKHKNKSKLTVSDLHCKLDDSTVNHYDKVELDKRKETNEVSNPHYSEVSIAVDDRLKPTTDRKNDNDSYKESAANNSTRTLQRDDNVLSKTEQGNPTTQEHPYSLCAYKTEAEKESQSNKSCIDQVGNQESHRIHQDTAAHRTMDVTSEYAVVNKSKKTSKLQSNESLASGADSVKESQSSEYDKLERNEPSKAIVTTAEDKNFRDRSPSPEYAELSTREMKVPGVTKYPTGKILQQEKSDSHEYNMLASVDHDSVKVKKAEAEAEAVQQHYYYSLEVKEECCSDNKGKEDTTDTHEYDKLANVDQDSEKVTKGVAEELEQHYYYSIEVPEESCSDNKGTEEITDSQEYNKLASEDQDSVVVTKRELNEVEQHYYYSLEVPEESCSDNKGKVETTSSHEYDKFANVDKNSAKATKAEAKEGEQHYYYSLEVPEESCSDNKGKEESTETVDVGEADYRMSQAHHFVIDDIPIVPNTTPQAALATVEETVVSTLDSHQKEATAD